MEKGDTAAFDRTSGKNAKIWKHKKRGKNKDYNHLHWENFTRF